MTASNPANFPTNVRDSSTRTVIRQRWLWVVLFCVASGVAFHPLPWLGFMDYDDPVLVTENTMVQRGLTWQGVEYAFTTSQINLWLPLTTLSHMMDVEVFGGWAGGHHLVNLMLHLATSLVLFALLNRHTGDGVAAWVVTILFAIHPLRVESVAWIAERKDVLSAFFYMLTLWYYAAWAAGKKKHHYALSLIAMAAGVLAKPSVLTVPLAMFCLDWWPLRRLEEKNKQNWLRLLMWRTMEKLPFILLAGAAAVTSWLSWTGNQFVSGGTESSLGWLVSTILLTYGTYLWRTFWPVDLAAFYPYPTPLPIYFVVAAAIALALFAVVAVRFRKPGPWLMFGLGWFVLLMLPGSGLILVSDHYAPDRYMYLGQIGLFVALVYSVRACLRGIECWSVRVRCKRAVALVLILVLMALAATTARQCWLWNDGPTLWTHTLAVTERNHVAHQQLGVYELQAGRLQEGIAHLQAASEIKPRDPAPYGNLALALARAGESDAALRAFHRAGPELNQRERFVTELVSAFDAYGQGSSPAATGVITYWLEQNPIDFNRTLELGHRLYGGGDYIGAQQAYQRAVELKPNHADATGSLGAIWLQLNAPEKAVPLLEQTAQNPADTTPVQTRHTLAQARLMSADFRGAAADYEWACKASPHNRLVRLEYAQLLLDSSHDEVFDPKRALEILEGSLTENSTVNDMDEFILLLRMMQVQVLAHDALDNTEEAKILSTRALSEIIRWRKARTEGGIYAGGHAMEPLKDLEPWFQQRIDNDK